MRRVLAAALLAACSAGTATQPSSNTTPPTPDAGADANTDTDADTDEPRDDSAGRATAYVFDKRAFEQPAATMTAAERSAWIAGQATFQLEWTAREGTDRGGLGPTFNALSCEACHANNGRGPPPLASDGELVTTLLRLGGADAYGDQLQHLANEGVPSEGVARVRWEETGGTYGDGSAFTLLRPAVRAEPALGAFPPGTTFSLRLAAQTFGTGFLEAIAEADILAREDPNDADGDGISGRANRVPDLRRGGTRVGRFGWKASHPTVEQQTAAAFAGDIGLTSSLFPAANCPPPQIECAAAASAAIELTESRLAAATTFMRGTTVPARRDVHAPEVIAGERLFEEMQCARCHVPSFVTGDVPDAPFLAHERVRPFTDLLLHDMGEGLADHRPDVEATGVEWRTPPLWGLGLLRVVSGHTRLLHDGRARDEAEAILWHGGEAQAAADRFRLAPASDRRALLAFLRSL
ncbi:MAG: thiol oxidoreductase [Labilithrix sp.]|nr:thiol oxidoreductase [Labilithrix sp.]MCW5817705.1 thiol oxidoreductase [Labilithrix sp.]